MKRIAQTTALRVARQSQLSHCVVDNVTISNPASAIAGVAVAFFSVTIRNVGPAEAADHTVTLYTSSDAMIDGGLSNNQIGESVQYTTLLAANGEETVSIDALIPIAGTYYYGACVTSAADSANHCFTSRQTFTFAKPDTSLHIHNAQTPEPEGGVCSDTSHDTQADCEGVSANTWTPTTRNLAVWVSIHPTDSALATASEAITINYTTGGGTGDTATADSDYTATSGTVTIPMGMSYASFDIPIIADSDDEDNETFTVSISNPTTTDSKVISIADSSATATIGDPDISSIYFYPNRPLMQGDGTTTNKGDEVYFDCYVQAPTGSPFGLSAPLLSVNNSAFVAFGLLVNTLSAGSSPLFFDFRNYSATGTPLLASSGLTRVVGRTPFTTQER